MPLTKEQRAARRAQAHGEERARLEAKLQKTIDLVTAMFWNQESGYCLSLEQVAACRHDDVLGSLWHRIWDFAEYRSRSTKLWRVGRSDDVSLYIEYEMQQCSADLRRLTTGCIPEVWFSDEVRAKALKGHPKAQALRKRFAKKQAA